MADFTLIHWCIGGFWHGTWRKGKRRKKAKGKFISWNQTLKDRNEFCTVSVSFSNPINHSNPFSDIIRTFPSPPTNAPPVTELSQFLGIRMAEKKKPKNVCFLKPDLRFADGAKLRWEWGQWITGSDCRQRRFDMAHPPVHSGWVFLLLAKPSIGWFRTILISFLFFSFLFFFFSFSLPRVSGWVEAEVSCMYVCMCMSNHTARCSVYWDVLTAMFAASMVI